MNAPKRFVIRFGNHWLLTDDVRTREEWVADRALASRHTREWAKQFAADYATDRKCVEVFTVEEVEALTERERRDRLRSAYFYALEAEIQQLAPDIDFYAPGVGCAAYCFAVDPNFGDGVTAQAAARVFLKNYRRRMGNNLRKRVPA
jgi:hypothetical protein